MLVLTNLQAMSVMFRSTLIFLSVAKTTDSESHGSCLGGKVFPVAPWVWNLLTGAVKRAREREFTCSQTSFILFVIILSD